MFERTFVIPFYYGFGTGSGSDFLTSYGSSPVLVPHGKKLWFLRFRFQFHNATSSVETPGVEQRWASKLFLKVCKSQIRKALGLLRYSISTNFLDVPIRKSPNCNFYKILQSSVSKQSLKMSF